MKIITRAPTKSDDKQIMNARAKAIDVPSSLLMSDFFADRRTTIVSRERNEILDQTNLEKIIKDRESARSLKVTLPALLRRKRANCVASTRALLAIKVRRDAGDAPERACKMRGIAVAQQF